MREIVSLILGALICFILMKQCNPSADGTVTITKSDTTEKIKLRIDTFELVRTQIEIRYATKSIPVEIVDTTACRFIRIYQDSIVKPEITFYYRDSVLGVLLGKVIDYKLANDTTVEKTITIRDSVFTTIHTKKGGFYANLGLGVTPSGLQTVLVGADWVSKNKVGFGYQYDISRATHNISVKYLLK